MSLPEGFASKALMALHGAKSTVETGDVIVSFLRQIIREIDDLSEADQPIDASYAFDWMGKIDLLTNKLESDLNILSEALSEAGVSPQRGVAGTRKASPRIKVAA
jgi:hypothetical protein